MGLIDDLKNQQNRELNEKIEKQQEWKRTIPEETARLIAEDIYTIMKDGNTKRIQSHRFTWDNGPFGKKKNCRYEYHLFDQTEWIIAESNEQLEISRSIYGYSNLTPNSNGHILLSRFFGGGEEPDSYQICCGNIENVKKVFSIAESLLRSENVTCVLKYGKIRKTKYKYNERICPFSFYISVPCQSDGML